MGRGASDLLIRVARTPAWLPVRVPVRARLSVCLPILIVYMPVLGDLNVNARVTGF